MSRILVVDDDPDMRALVGAYLKASGYEVDFAGDGVSGAQAAARRLPDLIITDFAMPRMDGFGLFNAVRADPRTARVPVVMLTAHNNREMLNKALQLGLDDFLGKPLGSADLLQVVAGRLKAVPPAPAPGAAPAAPAPPPAAAPRVAPPAQARFSGSVLCCRLCTLERFALALKKEELDELLARFAADATVAAERDAGWLTQAGFHHLFATFEDAGAVPHAPRALRAALCIVLAAQRLKPWVARRFAGRDLPDLVVALGVHSGTIETAPGPADVPALKGEAVEIAAFLAESALDLRWSVAASRAAAKSSGFSFVAGRGAQLRMPKTQGTVKAVEVRGLAPPTGEGPPPAAAVSVATLIEAAVDRNATLVNYAAAVAKKAPPAAAPAPAPGRAAAPAPGAAPAATRPARQPGEPVDGYSVVRKLADNGAVAVYLVNPDTGGAQVVLKTILITDEKKTKRPHLEKFTEQYAAIGSIDHPGVARTTAQGLTETHLYVVQEYCPGGDLRNLIAERMIAGDAIKALLRIASALKVAHQKGFIHGDLKPSNIMIRGDGGLAITDFALARIVEYAIGEDESGVLVRSPEYLSPEMINGLPADAQSDVYTLGLLLHEMLVGRRAYASPDLSRVMMAQLSAPVPQLPEGYQKFQPLLDKLMAKSRAERFASVPELITFMAQSQAAA